MRCCWTAALWKLTERESLPLSWSSTRCRKAEDNCRARSEWRACQDIANHAAFWELLVAVSHDFSGENNSVYKGTFSLNREPRFHVATVRVLFLLREQQDRCGWTDGSCPLANKLTCLPDIRVKLCLLSLSSQPQALSSLCYTALGTPPPSLCVWEQRSTLVSPSVVAPVFIVLIENFTCVYNVSDHIYLALPIFYFLKQGLWLDPGAPWLARLSVQHALLHLTFCLSFEVLN